MKPEPLNKKTFTTLQIKSLKPGGLENNRRLLSDKWVRVRDLKSACNFWLINKADAVCDQWDLLDMLDECKKLGLDKYDKNWFEEFYKRIKTLCDAGELFDISDEIDEYNDWLFKLAFKDVFGDKK